MTPPYYAVIFTSKQSEDTSGYSEMAEFIENLAKQQPGFLGIDSARSTIGITVSYWKTLEDITNWKQQTDHLQAQQLGRSQWYTFYNVKICKVEREYEFSAT
ncbi:antibiotic biosynthesis monooxygenase family protein [Formosa haliotis]|uniref:antibiotic biosynthesis monooxygenase family protein n=1 Tax=Formosa haliotis TaxID=1555194 RepID=UPI0008265F24|nr:antibiotic biosynthesis monooxygenase [Formosa haliotis]